MNKQKDTTNSSLKPFHYIEQEAMEVLASMEENYSHSGFVFQGVKLTFGQLC